MNKAQELGLEDKKAMILILHALSGEGEVKRISVGLDGSFYEMDILPRMKKLYNKIVKEPKYFAFYQAMRMATTLTKFNSQK